LDSELQIQWGHCVSTGGAGRNRQVCAFQIHDLPVQMNGLFAAIWLNAQQVYKPTIVCNEIPQTDNAISHHNLFIIFVFEIR
jgi:hypothetical protein